MFIIEDIQIDIIYYLWKKICVMKKKSIGD